MASYERWFAGKPEAAILRLMGLFDRPAEGGAIRALLAPPAIAGLTETLVGLPHDDWAYAVAALREARLLDAEDASARAVADPDALDAHPLVREHFGEQLRRANAAAWREAHGRLYEYYKGRAPECPDTLEAMAPLYAAVAHGCAAGRHQEALDEVYWGRIERGNEFYAVFKLGAFGADLAALAGFFDPPWRRPIAGLTEEWKALVLNQAGVDLRALGRLAEAREPMQASLDAYIAQKSWMAAARIASNLSELALAAGTCPRRSAPPRRESNCPTAALTRLCTCIAVQPWLTLSTRSVGLTSPRPFSRRRSGCRRCGSRGTHFSTRGRATDTAICYWGRGRRRRWFGGLGRRSSRSPEHLVARYRPRSPLDGPGAPDAGVVRRGRRGVRRTVSVAR